jgi:beta-lactamase regulating signal transducer with metallopeptidase domain/uncharacterized GH25 family protein
VETATPAGAFASAGALPSNSAAPSGTVSNTTPSTTNDGPALSMTEMLAVGYGIIVASLLAWYVAGILGLVRLYRHSEPAPAEVEEAFRRIAGPAGRSVTLLVSERVELPLAFRGWRSVIVLPRSLCQQGSDVALRYGLAHEWSHVEGGDLTRWYWTGLVQIVYFFNPLFWWLRRQLRLCQDYLADARAVEHARQREEYAEYLVVLGRRRLSARLAALGIGDGRSNLYWRIIMLLQSPQPLERRCVKRWTAGALAGGLAVLLLCSSVRLGGAAANADDKSPPAKEAAVQADKGETLNYTGRVYDKDTDKPIAGAIVTVRRSLLGDPELKERNPIMQETKHKTDENGKYSFTIPPEQTSKRYLYIELDVEHPDYAPRAHFGYALGMIRKNEKIGSRPFFENVEMRAGKAITGTVRTRDGQPTAGVKVQAYSVTNNRQDRFEYGSFTDTRTDAKGQFRLVVTTPGAAVIWLLPDDFVPSTHRVPEGKRGDLGTFTLDTGINIKGKVLDVRGQPVTGVMVNVERRGGREELEGLMVADMVNRSAVTNDKGEFTMKPLPPGEYDIHPADHARDGSAGQKRFEVPGVFMRQKLKLAADMPPLEVRAVPHVVIEAQYYDSKGKKSRGHAAHVFGQIDKNYWFGEMKVTPDGKMTGVVPHGLENVRLNLMTNEHGALRYRRSKSEAYSIGRELNLGTINDDVRDIEIIHYKAPMVVVKVAGKDGAKLPDAKLSGIYKSGKGERRNPINGPPTDIFFERQEDGRFHTFSLVPDEDFEITAHAQGYKDATLSLRLPEGETREAELLLEKN